MNEQQKKTPPRWLFTSLLVGALLACGIYIGIAHVEGASLGHIIRIAGFGALGALMLWGTVAKREA